MSATPIDYSLLDPGIRRLVRWLRSRGYETTDSGDGSKVTTMDCALAIPNVFIATTASRLTADADALLADLATIGVVLGAMSEEEVQPAIQATYDPSDGTAVLMLFGVSDADMPPLAN